MANIVVLLWCLICVDFSILLPYLLIKQYPIKIIFIIVALLLLSYLILLALVLTEPCYTGILMMQDTLTAQ